MKKYTTENRTSEHRKKYTGIYGSWYAMKQRCSNANNHQYKDYGGRGITYDPFWDKFENFKNDMGVDYRPGLTIDRIDTNGNYCRANCRWATRKEQNRNKRCNHIFEFKGQRMTLPEWAEKLGIGFGTLRSRFYRGMTTEEILKTNLYRPQKLI